ncbi:hypothetical protein PEX1_017370 [Penicillium expansum]|uniref:Uncharacterized protein n=1 Tax=Penicillium expansum TaxID=27334 RepID=A0A0A2JE95_PENEN|nr:hypothetical protein PEX2_057490 [Penicillium expansum]KGO40130.1 hypothetical protein PEXP_035140 [Penicillium expansum]KGO44697.1 hypothetical protein PEX1_017370 [Penicillium expansum]KGO53106.1 hypothetical protein PEX2_057490 [Penicillium expansum]
MAESNSPTSSQLELPESPSQIIGRRRNRLLSIIKQNDLSLLRQFIASCSPEDVIAPGTPYLEDTLFSAASYGSPEALRILLGVYAAAPEIVKKLNPNFRLLLDACGAANIDVVRFILDSHADPENPLPLGSVDLHQRDDSGDTPILAAAGSLIYPDEDADEVEDEGLDRNEWIRNRITRSHQLINFLLDRGCSATDVNPPLPNGLSPWGNQVQDSVIGLSVSTGSGPLIQRLVDSGADIYLKHQHIHHPRVPLQSSTTDTRTHDVTTLHLASLFYNSDAVKLLLNHQNHKANGNPDLTSSCDSDGRFPLHWAASGSAESDCGLLDKQLKISETLRLLLDHDSTGINLVDKTGSTPLHYAARSHARCGCTQYAELAIRNLLEYKADPRIPDGSGRTILHLLGYHSHQGDPINTTLLESILSHGANINHTEKNGKTALHVFTQNLRQVSAAKFLIEHGADFRARNTFRETPFHAAARGFLSDHVRRDGRDPEVTTANKIRLQDEIMLALNKAAGEDAAMLMNQPNAEGKTPRDLLEETRNRWQGIARPISGPGRGRGRGRGQPVGA